jgi:hypothetical protein
VPAGVGRDALSMKERAMDLVPADTRVFLFHSPNAARDTSGAMDAVNQWLSKDRSQSAYPHLRVNDITVTPDGAGGVYTIVVCTLGRAPDIVTDEVSEL